MKKLLMVMFAALMAAFMFSGCSTDKYYNPAKAAYQGAKEVVKNNKEKLSPETLEKLKKLDKNAVKYDETRTTIKDTVLKVKTVKEAETKK